MSNSSSLDPRFHRLSLDYDSSKPHKPSHLDQFETFEAFQQVKANKPFEHTGIVHAPSIDMAFLFAKEQYSRRGNDCLAMAIVRSRDIVISPFTEGGINIWDVLSAAPSTDSPKELYAVFMLKKRGKQHILLGNVEASSAEEAMLLSKDLYYSSPAVNLWVCKQSAILFSDEEDKDIWNTLNEKKYREAIAYKSADKIAEYKARAK